MYGAVAADQDGGTPVLAARQGVQHLRFSLLRAVREQRFMGNAARFQQPFDLPPCTLSRSAAGAGIYDQ
ncbi:hypothetical protein D3C73_1465930 [compost metagenome]